MSFFRCVSPSHRPSTGIASLLATLTALLVVAGTPGAAALAVDPPSSDGDASANAVLPSPPNASVPDSIVAVIAGDTLTASEFSEWYARSATTTEGALADGAVADGAEAPDAESPDAESPDAESPEDFLKRYVDFRLKVQAARDAGLDTLASMEQEIDAYRRQIARPTLMNDEIIDPIVREIYQRRTEEIDVSHILVSVEPDAAPSDTLAAYREMQSIIDTLDAGADFAEVARERSDDPSAQRESGPGAGGRLGYMTAGRLVKPFEDEMYATAVGERSGIFRTQYGYHILTVHDRRDRPAPVRVAHILIRPDEPADTAAARATADSLLTAIRSGDARFDSLAVQYSDDPRSAQRGGELGLLRPDQNVPAAFREAAFALKNAGDISDVVSTRFGFHLIRLLEKQERPTLEEAYDDLRQRVSQMPRVKEREQALARSVMQRRGATLDTATIAAAAYGRPGALDSLALPLARLSSPDAPEPDAPDAGDTEVATIGDSTFTISDVSAFVASNRRVAQQTVRDAAIAFMTEQALEISARSLEQRDPDFRRKMDEYRDGLLLFEFMQRRVWTPASRDTAGLRDMYRNHPERYRYPERVRALRLSAPADTLLTPYANRNAGDRSITDIAEAAGNDSLVVVDTLFVTPSAPDTQQPLLTAEDGELVGPVDSGGQRALFLRTGTEPPRRMTFEEARSRVIRDYQDAYEQEVLSRLRSEYNVETYPEHLPTLAAADGAGSRE